MRVSLGVEHCSSTWKEFGEKLCTKELGQKDQAFRRETVYPLSNDNGTSLERMGELDHVKEIRMQCVKKQKPQQKLRKSKT